MHRKCDHICGIIIFYRSYIVPAMANGTAKLEIFFLY